MAATSAPRSQAVTVVGCTSASGAPICAVSQYVFNDDTFSVELRQRVERTEAQRKAQQKAFSSNARSEAPDTEPCERH